MKRSLLLLAPCSLLLVSLSACEEATDRPSRAIATPVSGSSAQREVLADQPAGAVGVPLITIGMPNDKNDTAHIRTIGDNFNPQPAPATSTAPATSPAERSGTIDLTPRGTPPAAR